MSNKCCPTDVKPAMNDYKGVGSSVTLEGHFDMYVTGTGNHAVIVAYDVFGWTPNAEQLADGLAESGNFVVVIPDFYKGDPWPYQNIPPTKEGVFPKGVEPADGVDVLFNWIMNDPKNRFDHNDEISAVKEYMVKHYGAQKFGMVGMCWGGKVSFAAAKAGLLDGVATCHGSFLEKTDAEETSVPMCLLNSKEEPESYSTDIKPVVEAKPFASKNVYKDFPTMHHGWMGMRGVNSATDFNKQEVVDRYAEALADLVNFFKNAFE